MKLYRAKHSFWILVDSASPDLDHLILEGQLFSVDHDWQLPLPPDEEDITKRWERHEA